MDWQTLGAIAGTLSFFVTLAAEWNKLRRLGLQRLLVPLLVGTVIFLAVSQVPVIVASLWGSPSETPSLVQQGTQPTPQPQPTPTPDLWQFYVDDIKKSVPNASVTAETLKGIAAKIPESIPYFAEAEVGLIPYQYNGNIVDRPGPVSLNAPEGGYAYISWGSGKIKANEISVDYQWSEGNVYLVLVIGKPDDGTPMDLNTSLELSDFSSGNVYTNFAFPAPGQVFRGPIINKAWFSQQLWRAQRNNLITVSILDLHTLERVDYKVEPATLTWSTR